MTCVKALFAEASECAYPECGEPLILRNHGAETINAEIAHIRSEKDRGPRFDPSYPIESINDTSNLLLLCPKHHAVVDRNESSYPIEELVKWQSNQRASTKPGTKLSEAEARSFSDADWVPLDVEQFTAFSLSPASVAMIFKALSFGLIKHFESAPTSFTMVARVAHIERDDLTIPLIEFQSHQREALTGANDLYRNLMRTVLEIKQRGGDAQEAFWDEEFQQFEEILSSWKITTPDEIRRGSWTPLRVSYEPTLRQITFVRLDGRRNLRMYRSRLADTSDALEFIAAVTSNRIAYIESIDALYERPAAMRMATFLLDRHEIDLSRFRIVRNTPEEWDYLYPEYDVEVEEQG